jgi:hypothetical protein
MNSTTVQEAVEYADLPMEIETWSVYRACEQVTDGRHKRGVRYSVALILRLSVLARIGRDDNAVGDCAMGALASRVAEQGIARDTREHSVRIDRKPTCCRRLMPNRSPRS